MTDSSHPKSRGSLRLGAGERWALLSAWSYALTYVISGIAMRAQELDYILAIALRTIPVFLLALTISFQDRRAHGTTSSFVSDRGAVVALIVSGVLTFVIGNPLLLAALRAAGILVATPVIGTQTLWSALLAAVLLGEPFNLRMALAMLLGVVGVLVLTLGKTAQMALSPGWWLAVPYATGAALSWALGGVLSAKAMRRGVSRFQAVVTSSLTAIVCLNVYLLASGRIALYVTTPRTLVLSMLGAGVFNAVALIGLTSAIALTSVASATTIYSLQIAFAPLIAWLFAGEQLNAVMALGIVMIALGVIGVQRARL